MVRITDCLDMTIVVEWDVKPQNKQISKIPKGRMLYMHPVFYRMGKVAN